ncbi:hypothetical protein HOLDEFILI_02208 [Holdemania filiformis DSM 12042]|uniref:Uncharacterized protein n=1 Tax=Holdemania filiformis DSM 12042 TaxID=545696 RepID=B9Y8R1_9FIRM|nr:hypothetical protein HOLDEFILI_02208 [Holdemania filiformis DSM 12042]
MRHIPSLFSSLLYWFSRFLRGLSKADSSLKKSEFQLIERLFPGLSAMCENVKNPRNRLYVRFFHVEMKAQMKGVT